MIGRRLSRSRRYRSNGIPFWALRFLWPDDRRTVSLGPAARSWSLELAAGDYGQSLSAVSRRTAAATARRSHALPSAVACFAAFSSVAAFV
jgi:hypothetical protein